MRTFETGATRDNDTEKFDYEGFLSPIVLHRYARFMHKHRKQADGNLRDSDNWQKGIPLPVYMKSLWRHFMDLWLEHRLRLWYGADVTDETDDDNLEEALCAILFNTMGYLHEHMRTKKTTTTADLCPPPADRPKDSKSWVPGHWDRLGRLDAYWS